MAAPSKLPEPWLSLKNRAGSVKALAEAFGVSPSTIWRYGNGTLKLEGPALKLYDYLVFGHEPLPKKSDDIIDIKLDGIPIPCTQYTYKLYKITSKTIINSFLGNRIENIIKLDDGTYKGELMSIKKSIENLEPDDFLEKSLEQDENIIYYSDSEIF